MNDELQSQLAEILKSITSNVAEAKDFAVEQLPDIAQQYILFGLVWETVALTALIGMSAVLAAAFKRFWNLSQKAKYDDIGPFMGMLFSGVFVFISALVTISQMKDTILVWFAPKIYLLQGIAGLLK